MCREGGTGDREVCGFLDLKEHDGDTTTMLCLGQKFSLGAMRLSFQDQ